MKNIDIQKNNMNSLIHSNGWKDLKEIMGKMIQEYEANIMEVGGEKNEVKYTENDIYRLVRKVLIKIKDEPERIVNMKNVKGHDLSKLL